MIQKLQTNLTGYTIRKKTFKGKEYLVVPVVMMRDGVHRGSQGVVRHTEEELSKYVECWNGIPVTVSHPSENGQPVSANSPAILEQYAVGTIFNSRMDGDKLKAEAYIDETTLQGISENALLAIKNQRPLDVSVGVFSDDIENSGEWNGETYEAIATNYRPDHLALLPGQQGACSWEDGCGIRTNQNTKDMNAYKHEKPEKMLAVNELAYPKPEGLQLNEMGYVRLREILQLVLDRLDDVGNSFFLEELYQDHFIGRIQNVSGTFYFQQSYILQPDNSVELVGERQNVKKETNYIQINEKGESNMSEIKKPCCPEKVTELINHELTSYTESDRDWLNGVESDRLERMFPKEPKVNVSEKDVKEFIAGYAADKVVELLPEAIQTNVTTGLQILEDVRNEKIETILNNSEEGTWEKEELATMSDSLLDKLVKTVASVDEREESPADYSGQGVSSKRTKVQTNSGTEVEGLLPAGVKTKED
jgi:hypothetical protein